MSIVAAFALGVIQGITEFLPISSTGHLILARLLIPLEAVEPLLFDAMVHVGTLIAVLTALRPEVIRVLRGLVDWVFRHQNPDSRLAGVILLGTVPAAVAGYVLEDIIERSLRSEWVVVIALAVVALIFLLVEERREQAYRQAGRAREVTEVSWSRGLLMGVAQAIALIPGVSRSGITIAAGMLLDLTREAAARFAFLLSIPIILGAGVRQLTRLGAVTITPEGWGVIIAGVIGAVVAGFLAIRLLLRFLATGTLRPFAYYRLAIALVIALVLFIVER